jgi:hypothetical protein
MGNRFGARALVGALLVAIALAGIGYWSYNAGVAQGMAEAARAATVPGGAAAPYAYPPYMWHRPWGFGFFPIFPILFILFWVFLLRGFFWRGGCGRGPGYRDGVPPGFDEWHRRAHEQDGSLRTSPGTQSSPS